jgi:hypothetical protein
MVGKRNRRETFSTGIGIEAGKILGTMRGWWFHEKSAEKFRWPSSLVRCKLQIPALPDFNAGI